MCFVSCLFWNSDAIRCAVVKHLPNPNPNPPPGQKQTYLNICDVDSTETNIAMVLLLIISTALTRVRYATQKLTERYQNCLVKLQLHRNCFPTELNVYVKGLLMEIRSLYYKYALSRALKLCSFLNKVINICLPQQMCAQGPVHRWGRHWTDSQWQRGTLQILQQSSGA